MMSNRFVRALTAPVLAVVIALTVSAILLQVSGHDAADIFRVLEEDGFTTRTIVNTINRAAPYYLSGIAVAIGFKMGLFNIGVEGQYRVGALIAAAVGGALTLPAPLHVGLILLAGMLVGMAWASIAGVLKATRGVSEVISTIMLNSIALGVTPYLLEKYFRRPKTGQADYAKVTRTIADSGRLPNLNGAIEGVGAKVPQGATLQSYVLIAAVVGVAYYVVVWRTRFGFDLRATGSNPSAATASGVNAKRMVIVALAFSGAVAGLVGLAPLLTTPGYYSSDTVVQGLGFTGIAVALLGRNNPVGVAIGALLWAYMDILQTPLSLADLPREIVAIMQGLIVLSVVIAYEVVRRLSARHEAAVLQRAEGAPPPGPPDEVTGAPAVTA